MVKLVDRNLNPSYGRGLMLFVPATRPERFGKAVAAGADAIVIDLEDAVAAGDKVAARDALRGALSASFAAADVPLWVRVNAMGTAWREADISIVKNLPIAGVMLPKAEDVDDVERIAGVMGGRERIIALVETARGISLVRKLAEVAGRIAFGSIDFAADVGVAHVRESLLAARSELVLASRLAGLGGPIDGVTTAFDDEAEVEADAAYASSLGFAGKLLIHPRQVGPAGRGFRPSDQDIAWAERILAIPEQSVGVVDGCMVDEPVRLSAQQLLRRNR